MIETFESPLKLFEHDKTKPDRRNKVHKYKILSFGSMKRIQCHVLKGNSVIVGLREKNNLAGYAVLVTGISGGYVYIEDSWAGFPKTLDEITFKQQWELSGKSAIIFKK
jgi:hypothetical protein